MDYIIRKLVYGDDTRKIKMYFHVVYGGGRRRYGGAGRNSPSCEFRLNVLRA